MAGALRPSLRGPRGEIPQGYSAALGDRHAQRARDNLACLHEDGGCYLIPWAVRLWTGSGS